jgi:hypothetical protein
MMCGIAIMPSTRPMFREMKFHETVLSERSTRMTSSPICAAASFIGPSGFHPVREMTTTKSVSTMTRSRLVLKIWM